ncbi:hypothetical protein KY290_017400 [Solanum tuberosum]|uniref:RNase H type-1 domain-containing protein n=1 Tax=Solanum tuberosum TaxID=4113 RepID=A0ABQ7VB61_SOLTU|nr:hypothetical protein KY290_017400 [Solanum tuberosum]
MGDINVQDDVTAELEALTHELNRCKKGEPHVEQLIVESDNVMLVQYVNGRPEPNEITMQRLKKISNLLKCITCAVYHVTEEANKAIIDYVLTDGQLCFGFKGIASLLWVVEVCVIGNLAGSYILERLEESISW